MPFTINNLASPLPNISLALQPVVLPCSAWDQTERFDYAVPGGCGWSVGTRVLALVEQEVKWPTIRKSSF